MRRRSSRIRVWCALALALPAVAGCASSYSIEPGLWSLSFDLVKRTDEGTVPVKRKAIQAEVVLDREYDDIAGQEVETVQVWLLPESENQDDEAARHLDPLEGSIGTEPASGKRKIRLKGVDPRWEFNMWAYVRSPSHLRGLLVGRPRLSEKELVEGTWDMKKIPDEEWTGFER